MHFGADQDLELLALLVAVGGLLALAPTLRCPCRSLLVLGGVVMGFIPGCRARRAGVRKSRFTRHGSIRG